MKQGLEFYSGYREIACIGQIERAGALESAACICSIEHGCGCSCLTQAACKTGLFVHWLHMRFNMGGGVLFQSARIMRRSRKGQETGAPLFI